MKTLFDISQELLLLELQLEEAEGEMNDALEEWFDQLNEEKEQKLDNYAALIRELEARSYARTEEAKRLKELADADKKKAERLKARLKAFFMDTQLQKIETDRFKLSIRKNGGVTPLIFDEHLEVAALPDAYRVDTVIHKANTEAIRSALDNGEELPFVKYGERGTSLSIK